jgi:hypothetical protein
MFVTPDLDSAIFETCTGTLINSCQNHGHSPPPRSLTEEGAAGKFLWTVEHIGLVVATLAVIADDKLLVGIAYSRVLTPETGTPPLARGSHRGALGVPHSRL